MHPRHLSLPFSLLNCRTIKYFSISKQKPYILRSLSLPPFLSLPFLILSIITEKMSINHYSSDHSQPQWWSPYMMDTSANSSSPNQKPSSFISTDSHFLHNSTAAGFCQLSSNHHLYRTTAGAMFRNPNGATFGFDLNNEDEEDEHQVAAADGGETAARESGEEEMEIPKERLFEKPLTPSDVGKLNRLVIPKQHAEKHFPLNGGAEPGDNGLLLGFEDEIGKSWRFRYSYWNSSQSYVLTKGWSRFVKEKRLDAGDIVVFARHRMDTGRLFIDWRRRNSGSVGIPDGGVSQPAAAVANGVGSGWSRLFYASQYPYSSQHHQAGPSSLPYQPESLHAGTAAQQKQTTRAGSGNSKRLRLFGVNMECHHESEPSTPVGSPMSSQGQAHHPYHHQYYSNNHMVTHLF